MDRLRFWLSTAFWVAMGLAGVATFVFLTFFDGYVYNGWNWLIAIPVNAFLSGIWPLYWLGIRPFFGH